ncbi:hypothetical protein ACFE04_030307 [Oxalis oulophora]
MVSRCVSARRRVPCFFIFGDSLVDSGNNNHLRTNAKANYKPYGIDFPDGATGRFTNGRTAVDFLAEYMGFKDFIPPYTTANSYQLKYGVNYASGSAGILRKTGRNLGTHVSLYNQLKRHRKVISRLNIRFGNESVTAHRLQKCLYYVGMGSNDYLNNYFLPKDFDTSKRYNASQYADLLTKHYSRQLKALYKYGARKVAVNGLSIIGCVPFAIRMTNNTARLCFDEMNTAAQMFNIQVGSLIDDLNRNLTNANFVFINNLWPMLSQVLEDLPGNQRNACCDVDDAGFCIRNKKDSLRK